MAGNSGIVPLMRMIRARLLAKGTVHNAECGVSHLPYLRGSSIDFADYVDAGEDQVTPHNVGQPLLKSQTPGCSYYVVVSVEIANCPPYFLIRIVYGGHIGLWILHPMLLILLILNAKAARPAQYAIGQRRINVCYLTRIAKALSPLLDSWDHFPERKVIFSMDKCG